MINPLPWKLDESGDKIYDANGDIIAEDYIFNNMDDFEAICEMVNSSQGKAIKQINGLLPCPFCGGNNLEHDLSDIDGWVANVKCNNCDDMAGPMSKYKYSDQDEAKVDATECWNKRAT